MPRTPGPAGIFGALSVQRLSPEVIRENEGIMLSVLVFLGAHTAWTVGIAAAPATPVGTEQRY